MNECWIVTHPRDESQVWVYKTKKQATIAAIKKNKATEDHWAFRLYHLKDGRIKFIGCLWRAFGCSFNHENCWQ